MRHRGKRSQGSSKNDKVMVADRITAGLIANHGASLKSRRLKHRLKQKQLLPIGKRINACMSTNYTKKKIHCSRPTSVSSVSMSVSTDGIEHSDVDESSDFETGNNSSDSDCKVSGVASAFKYRSEQSRAVKRLRNALPSSPAKRVATMLHYVTDTRTGASPTSKSVFNMISPSAEDIQSGKIGLSVLNDVKEIVNNEKHKRNKQAQSVLNVLSSAVNGEAVQKSKSKTKLSQMIGLTPRRLSNGRRIRTQVLKNRKSAFTYTIRKNKNCGLSEELKKMVFNFWMSAGISRPTGNKSDIVRRRLGPHVYSSHMMHVLENTQTECYIEFKRRYPEIIISQRAFEGLKPYFVKPVRNKDRLTCCCRYHVETRLLFKSCMKFRSRCTDRNNTEYPIYDSLNDIVNETLCPIGNIHHHHNKECLERECVHCGTDSLKLLPEELNDDEDTQVEWRCYDYVNMKVKGGIMKKKLTLVSKKTTPMEMFTYFRQILKAYPSHQFRSKWQSTQLRELIDHLPMNHCICIHDFSENYGCKEQVELQSTYFQRTEVSIHVTLMYRHAILEYDGIASSENDPNIVQEQFFVISPDLTHDHHFTNYVQKSVSEYLKSIAYNVEIMHEFTDGCACQYKSRHCIGDISLAVSDLGYPVYRNFFETSHAKGPQDAAGGLLKQQCDMAVLRGTATIQNAKDVHTFAEKNLTIPKSKTYIRRVFRYICEIPRDRSRQFKPVPENRKLHQIRTANQPGSVILRNLTCYSCDECCEQNYSACLNSSIIGESRTLVMKKEQHVNNVLEEIIATAGNSDGQLSDAIHPGCIIALYTDDENEDYYLINCIKVFTLKRTTRDDWGNSFITGSRVIQGKYYKKVSANIYNYELIPNKTCLVPLLCARYILTEDCVHGRLLITDDTHMDILANL